MSFFKKLLGQSNIENDFNMTLDLMINMANESERAHRAMIDLYNEEVRSQMLKGEITEASWRSGRVKLDS